MEYRVPESYGVYVNDTLNIRQDMDDLRFETEKKNTAKGYLSIIEKSPREKSLVRLYIADILVEVELGWIYRYAKNSLLMPDGFDDYFGNYVFKQIGKQDKKIRISEEKPGIDYVILFKSPIYILRSELACMFPDGDIDVFESNDNAEDERFRLIPEFSWLAISKSGEIYNIENGQRINPSFVKHSVTKKPTFPIVTFDTEFTRTGIVTRSLHKLVAQTWVENDDWINKTYVLFRDGNILNYDADNLYWATKEERHTIKKARENTTIERSVKVYDSKNKEIYIFENITDACSELKIEKDNLNIEQLDGYLRFIIANDRYELRYLNDCSSFLAEKNIRMFLLLAESTELLKSRKIRVVAKCPAEEHNYVGSLDSISGIVSMPSDLVLKCIIDGKQRKGWFFDFAHKNANLKNSIVLIDKDEIE